MNKLLVLIALLLTTGCSDFMNQHHLKNAIDVCGGVDGIYSISAYPVGDNLKVYCKDGTYENVNGEPK